jgi:hypothetical protein
VLAWRLGVCFSSRSQVQFSWCQFGWASLASYSSKKKGNNFITIPYSIKRLYHQAYLNLSHCHSLGHLPELPTRNGPSDSVGRYFRTASVSRDHRSGIYIFDCPKSTVFTEVPFEWIERLVEVRISAYFTFPLSPVSQLRYLYVFQEPHHF